MQHTKEFAIWLRKAFFAFHRRVDKCMSELGITAEQYVVLDVVAREPGITQIKIAERIGSDANTVGAIVKLLGRHGLVRRKVLGRARPVFLTAAGRSLHRTALKEHERLGAALRDGAASDYDQSVRFLKRIHQVFYTPPTAAKGRSGSYSSNHEPAP